MSSTDPRNPDGHGGTNAHHPVMNDVAVAVAVPCAIFFATVVVTALWASIIWARGRAQQRRNEAIKAEKQARFEARSS